MGAGIITGGVILVLAFVVVATCLLGARAKKRLAAKYPSPGKMVDVGG